MAKKVTRRINTVKVKLKGSGQVLEYPGQNKDTIVNILKSGGCEIESATNSLEIYECTEEEFLSIATRKESKS